MSDYTNSSLTVAQAQGPTSGSTAWRSPSNIAIIKYWGKHGLQLPNNPSVSFTLTNAHTETRVIYSPGKHAEEKIDLSFYFEGEAKPDFHPKIFQFIDRVKHIFPFLYELKLEIHSSNSFPHSAGIASSASSMSALAMCFCSMEQQLFGTLKNKEAFLQKASYISRLGSGSACRSVFPLASVWGKHSDIPGSDDEYGIGFEGQLHEVFHSFRDDILIVSKSEKEVSSTLGHALMDSNVFAGQRFLQARQNMSALLPALREGDLERFGEIAEAEALSLHALMMTSSPSFILMAPNSLEAIARIRRFRKERRLPVYFTLDAGPNIHLMYPSSIEQQVATFKNEQLQELCEGGQILNDQVGQGPEKII
jgi:diphosphomevalonate decarboxylase